MRVEGYVFAFNQMTMAYIRRPELRNRIIGLLGSGYIINVLPPQVNIDRVRYEMIKGRLSVSDGSDFSLDLDEYNWST